MYKYLLRFVLLYVVSFSALASTIITIDDASKLKYQMSHNGEIFFRNLDEFNPNVTPCCYAFVLDITTDYGKALWSTIMMKMATKGSIKFVVSNPEPPRSGDPAAITHAGNW